MAHVTGTLAYDTTAGEQTLYEMTITKMTKIGSIFLDLSNMLTPIQISLYVKIDGANYRSLGTPTVCAGVVAINLLNAMPNEALYSASSGLLLVDTDIKITIQEPPA